MTKQELDEFVKSLGMLAARAEDDWHKSYGDTKIPTPEDGMPSRDLAHTQYVMGWNKGAAYVFKKLFEKYGG